MRAETCREGSRGIYHLSCSTGKVIMVILLITATGQASSQPCPESKEQSCCSDGYGLNYTLPMFDQCLTTRQEDGSSVQTIPKLIPAFSLGDTQCRMKNKHGIPPGTRVCRVPDCMKEPCSSGWCEETMTGFHCHVLESNVTPRNTTTLSSVESPTSTLSPVITTSTGHSSSRESDSSTTTLEPVARCPDNWVEGRISNKCYFLDLEGSWATWYHARNVCADINVTNPNGRVIHAQLLVLESNDEMLELRQNLIDSFELWYDRWRNVGRVWLNCNDMEKEGTYYCDTHGESIPMQYSNWDDGQPSDDGTGDNPKDCVSTLNYWPFRWTLRDLSCAGSYSKTVCEITRFGENSTPSTQSAAESSTSTLSSVPTSPTQSSMPQEASCPDQWVEGANKCYYYTGGIYWHPSQTWNEARNVCADINVTNPNGRVINAQLLVLESNDEMLELRQILIDLYENWYWWWSWWYSNRLGIWLNCNDIEEEGTFYCDTNGESIPMQYTNWADDKPDDNVTDNSPEDCVSTVGYWPFVLTFDDVSCDDGIDIAAVICEINKF